MRSAEFPSQSRYPEDTELALQEAARTGMCVLMAGMRSCNYGY
jgi:hypothetical protein